MTITQVALSNTFNEFRQTVNEIGNTVVSFTDGTGNITADFLSANVSTVTDLTVSGNLTVQGTETILNTSTLTVEDKNIVVANGAADASAANGAGLTIDGADATIEYISANDNFQFNKSIQTTGNVTGLYLIGDGTFLTNAGATITDDTTSATDFFVLFDDVTSGSATTVGVSSTKLIYVPSTGNLTATIITTDQISGNVVFTSTGQIELPVGATADRGSSNVGSIRYNSEVGSFEGYGAAGWGAIGGGGGAAAVGGGDDEIFFESEQTANTTYTITPNKNALTTGPLTIANNVTVTVPSGTRFVII
jgi:hypothetical protein